jgi:Flp pilus assembly protein TadG
VRRCRGDEGNAIVEFVYLGVLLMVPLVYVLITVFQVQSAAFAVTEAARQAGRAYAQADSSAEAHAVATAAVDLALRDQGIESSGGLDVLAPDGLAPGATVRVTVAHDVTLPLLGGLFGRVEPRIPVRATHVEVVDRFRERPVEES